MEQCDACEKHRLIYPSLCEGCTQKDIKKPKIEKLFSIAQEQFLATRDDRFLSIILEECYEVGKNLVYKKIVSSGKFLNEEEILDMSGFVVEKMLTYYRRDGFSIKNSFVGYLSKVVLQPLYNEKKQRRQSTEVSIESNISYEGANSGTLKDMLSAKEFCIEETLLNKVSEGSTINEIIAFLEVGFNTLVKVASYREAVDCYILLYYYLSEEHNNYMKFTKNKLSPLTYDHFESLSSSLKNFLKAKVTVRDDFDEVTK